MATLQAVAARSDVKCFGDILDGIQQFLIRAFDDCNTVHVVSDRYDNGMSIKAGERKRRGFVNAPEIKVNSRDQVLPRNIKAFLSNPRNKDNLNKFAFEEWCKSMPAILTNTQTIVLAGGFEDHEKVVEITRDHIQEIPELFSNHEEADSRIFLHVHDSIIRYQTTNAIIAYPI